MVVNKKLLLLAGGALLAIIILFFSISTVKKASLDSALEIEVAPESSKVTIDGDGSRQGVVQVKPGTHRISVSKEGFETVTRTVSVVKDETKYVGIVLASNSDETADWYRKNAGDQKRAEGISSKNFDQSGKDLRKSLPILKILPFVDRYYRIDYGPSKTDRNDPSKAALYVKYYSEQGKQDAADFLKFNKVDPAKIEIYYTSANESS